MGKQLIILLERRDVKKTEKELDEVTKEHAREEAP